MLNTFIVSSHAFELLTTNISRELITITNELKGLNKVEEIKSKLELMYGSIRSEAYSSLEQVNGKFQEHETDFKKRLCMYVHLIKGNFQTLHEQPSPKIGDLKNKIKELYHDEGSRQRTGKLKEIVDGMRTLERKYYKDIGFYMKFGELGPDEIRQVVRIGERAREFIGKINEHLIKIKETTRRIKGIIGVIKDGERLEGVVEEFSKFNKTNIDEYQNMIEKHKSKLDLFNLLPDMKRRYDKSLEETKKVIKNLKELKEQVRPNQALLDNGFYNAITSITDIEEKELDGITTDIQEIIDTVKTTQNFIDNTKLFFGYLKTFQSHNSKIEKLEIQGKQISDTQKTIKSIEGVISALLETQTPIHKAKENLGGEYKPTWKEDRDRNTEMTGIKTQFFPKDLRVFDYLGQIEDHKSKMEAVQFFNSVLESTDLGTFLNSFDVRRDGTRSIRELSSALQKMDSCLSSVKEVLLTGVQIIQSSHESSKKQLNSTPNGNGIERMVEEIKKIPGKLSKLHESVKIYIQLTQIVSRVIETLDKMKPKGLELIGINDVFGNIWKCAE